MLIRQALPSSRLQKICPEYPVCDRAQDGEACFGTHHRDLPLARREAGPPSLGHHPFLGHGPEGETLAPSGTRPCSHAHMLPLSQLCFLMYGPRLALPKTGVMMFMHVLLNTCSNIFTHTLLEERAVCCQQHACDGMARKKVQSEGKIAVLFTYPYSTALHPPIQYCFVPIQTVLLCTHPYSTALYPVICARSSRRTSSCACPLMRPQLTPSLPCAPRDILRGEQPGGKRQTPVPVPVRLQQLCWHGAESLLRPGRLSNAAPSGPSLHSSRSVESQPSHWTMLHIVQGQPAWQHPRRALISSASQHPPERAFCAPLLCFPWARADLLRVVFFPRPHCCSIIFPMRKQSFCLMACKRVTGGGPRQRLGLSSSKAGPSSPLFSWLSPSHPLLFVQDKILLLKASAEPLRGSPEAAGPEGQEPERAASAPELKGVGALSVPEVAHGSEARTQQSISTAQQGSLTRLHDSSHPEAAAREEATPVNATPEQPAIAKTADTPSEHAMSAIVHPEAGGSAHPGSHGGSVAQDIASPAGATRDSRDRALIFSADDSFQRLLIHGLCQVSPQPGFLPSQVRPQSGVSPVMCWTVTLLYCTVRTVWYSAARALGRSTVKGRGQCCISPAVPFNRSRLPCGPWLCSSTAWTPPASHPWRQRRGRRSAASLKGRLTGRGHRGLSWSASLPL